MWILKVKVISWPWPKVIYIWKLKLAFLRNHLANQSQIFICKHSGTSKEMKFYWHDGGHITKMAAMPIYGKNPFKNLHLRNRWTDFRETWYVASVTPAHHSLFKLWPWVDLDLLNGKVKFGNKGLSIGKSENCWFFRTIAACDLKPMEIMKICEYWRSRSFLDLGPRSFTFEN